MKRILSTLLFTLLSLGVFAQEGIPLLDKVEGNRVQFHYTYSLSQNGSAFVPVTDGDVTVEGNDYILQGLGLEVISDGLTRWTLDREAKEALIEKVEQEDLFTNPALFIASYKKYMKAIRVLDSGRDFLDVTLQLDKETCARFELKGIVFGAPQGKSDFSPDEKSLSKEYVITDLR